jgi:hypothetical protein
MSKIFELIEENAGKFVLLAGAIIAILIYLMGVSTNLDYTYSTLITISATLFGFFITALSILLLVFDDNNVKNKPLLRVIQSAKSFPMLYDYMFYAIYSFGATISVFLIIWTSAYKNYIIIDPVLAFFLILETGMTMIGLILLRIMVINSNTHKS